VADHSLAAPGLLAQILVAKYCDHLPFYRQEQIFRQRHDVFISRQQMVQWTFQSVRLLSGISDFLKKQMRQSGYVQVDETPVRYQDPTCRAAADKVICGWRRFPTGAWCLNGTPAGRRVVWTPVGFGLSGQAAKRRPQRLSRLCQGEGGFETLRLLGACAAGIF